MFAHDDTWLEKCGYLESPTPIMDQFCSALVVYIVTMVTINRNISTEGRQWLFQTSNLAGGVLFIADSSATPFRKRLMWTLMPSRRIYVRCIQMAYSSVTMVCWNLYHLYYCEIWVIISFTHAKSDRVFFWF